MLWSSVQVHDADNSDLSKAAQCNRGCYDLIIGVFNQTIPQVALTNDRSIRATHVGSAQGRSKIEK